MSLVVPAVLPSSRHELEEKLALFAQIPSVDRVQIDVVDGKFSSPASYPYSANATQGTSHTPSSPKATEGHSALTELRQMIRNGIMLPYLDHLEYEIDLMCFDAEQAAAAWLAQGAMRLTFHLESTTDLARLLKSARQQYGSLVSFGVAINIATDIAPLELCLEDVAYVQFMGIAHIGRQGQVFDRRVLDKIRTFRERHPAILVQVDGGISLSNARELIVLGVSNLIVGSAILDAADPLAAAAAFEALENPYSV